MRKREKGTTKFNSYFREKKEISVRIQLFEGGRNFWEIAERETKGGKGSWGEKLLPVQPEGIAPRGKRCCPTFPNPGEGGGEVSPQSAWKKKKFSTPFPLEKKGPTTPPCFYLTKRNDPCPNKSYLSPRKGGGGGGGGVSNPKNFEPLKFRDTFSDNEKKRTVFPTYQGGRAFPLYDLICEDYRGSFR